MQRLLLAPLIFALLAAPARAGNGGAAPPPPGGVGGASPTMAPSAPPAKPKPKPAPKPAAGHERRGGSVASVLATLSAPHVAYGPNAVVRVRVGVSRRAATLRLVLVRASNGAAVASVDAGRVAAGTVAGVRWRLSGVPEGSYRVRVTGPVRAGSLATGVPVLVRFSRFPVVGPHTFGGSGSRFGAGRAGHIHQGQDIPAAEGTPIVAPRAGVVQWSADQPGGAGLYLVIHGDDGRDYVFMHLHPGSIRVRVGQRVSTGQRIAEVGSTGDATGPHLHFEIWVGGWQSGGHPIDPLPELLRWDAYS